MKPKFYFVSPSIGDDANAGTQEKPFCTLDHAKIIANQYDWIFVVNDMGVVVGVQLPKTSPVIKISGFHQAAGLHEDS